MVPKQFPPVELLATIVFFNVTVPCELPTTAALWRYCRKGAVAYDQCAVVTVIDAATAVASAIAREGTVTDVQRATVHDAAGVSASAVA